MRENNNAQGVPYASVSYGPLLFALPIPDTDDPNTPDPAASGICAGRAGSGLTVERDAMPAKWDWPLAAPLKLRVNAVAIDWQPDSESTPLAAATSRRKPRAERASRSSPMAARSSASRCSRSPQSRKLRFRPCAGSCSSETASRCTVLTRTSVGPAIGVWQPVPRTRITSISSPAILARTGSAPEILVRNIADFERNYASYDVHAQMEELFAFDADLVVLAIGENVPPLESRMQGLNSKPEC